MKINPLYILPNLFTAGSMFLAIVSVIYASQENYIYASWAIVISMVLDGLDGRVARLTNTASKFGVEFDSLADVVAFGVAPAMLVYFYIGQYYGRLGMVICALFVVLGAIRLARFNITSTNEPNSFIGLPIPAAAAFIVSWILFNQTYQIFGIPEIPKLDLFDNSVEILADPKSFLGYLFLLCMLMVGVLMVSNIRYPSFKKMQWNLKMFILLLVFLAVILYRPIESLVFFMSVYLFYGLIRWLWLVMRIKTKANQ